MTESRGQQSQPLDYQQPLQGRRYSAWSVVGFALALLAAIVAGLAWWGWWQSIRSGARGVWYGVSDLYCLDVVAATAACVIGLVRGGKRFAVAGLILAALSAVSVFVLVRGSPW